MAAMSQIEHEARAALMGLEYVKWAHAYMTPGREFVGNKSVRIDADTLEPLDDGTILERAIQDVGGNESFKA